MQVAADQRSDPAQADSSDDELRQAYRMLFASEGTLMERMEDLEKMFSANPLVQQIVDFIKTRSDRSFCVPNNNASASSQN